MENVKESCFASMTLNSNTKVKKENKKNQKKHIHYKIIAPGYPGYIHHEFLIEIKKVNAAFYINVLKYWRDTMTGIFYSVQAGAFYQLFIFRTFFDP